MSTAPYLYKEYSVSGHQQFKWRAGQVGFFPQDYVREIDYSEDGAEIAYLCVPTGMLAQAMPPGKWEVFRQRDDPVMQHLIKAANDLQPDDDPLLVDAITLAAIYRAAQWHEGSREPVSKNAARITRAVEYMRDNLARRMTMNELAAVAFMSPYHFARTFHQVTGKSPHAYVVGKRIERAKAMLTSGPIALATIALECGFSNQAHFTRQFRTHMGTTPAAFRREMGLKV